MHVTAVEISVVGVAVRVEGGINGEGRLVAQGNTRPGAPWH